MRVNMDSSILSDPRFKRLAKSLGIPLPHAVGSCFFVWLACYERRSETLEPMDIDLAADMDGFAEAMMKAGLAHRDGDLVIVHGVTARIDFLQKQKDKGGKGGKSKAQKTREKKASVAPATAPRLADATADSVANATGAALAYSPAPAPALSLSPAPTPPPAPPPEPCVGDDENEIIAIAPFAELVTAWNATELPGAGKIRRDPTRVGFWQQRLADEFWREHWREAVARAGKSDRCRGLAKGWSGLMVDTFLKDPSMLTRILEGEFDNPGANRPPPAPTVYADPNDLPTNRIAPPLPKAGAA